MSNARIADLEAKLKRAGERLREVKKEIQELETLARHDDRESAYFWENAMKELLAKTRRR